MDYPILKSSYNICYVNNEGQIPHTHDDTSEIIQTFDSHGSILINDTLIQFPKNGLFFINGASTHFVAPDNPERYPHSIMQIFPAELEKMCKAIHIYDIYEKLFLKNCGTICSLSEDDAILVRQLFLNADRLCKEDDLFKYSQQIAVLTELFAMGLRNVTPLTEKSDIVKKILFYINENIFEKITLEEISSTVHMSKSYMCRIFKDNIGVSIGSYIKNKRLTLAKQMLEETNMTITKIAVKCLFTDSAFFSKTFLKEFGVTPSEYRRKHK